MSVKLGRVVFRKIGGRIVPIRIGAEAKTIAAGISGVSKKLIKKANLLFSTRNFKVGSTGNLLKLPEADSTKAMLKFMDKSGSIRFDSNSGAIDLIRKPTSEQKMALAQSLFGKEIFVDITTSKGLVKKSGSFENFSQALRSGIFSEAKPGIAMNGGKKDVAATKLFRKAKKLLGLTEDPREAGYITRAGKFIDLSGKKDGGEAGIRALDHREVASLFQKRASKPTNLDILNSLRQSQKDRKRMAEKTHIVTNLKNDIKKIWPERKEFRDVIKSMVKDLRFKRKSR